MLKSRSSCIVAVIVALLVGAAPGWAQQSAGSSATATAPTSQQELDSLLAPIALYPDSLLAQILMATTYPLEVVIAARWSKANPNIKGKALEDAMQKQEWDPAVKALTTAPKVLDRLSENLAWMHKLGDAFLADQKAVLNTVQALRTKAQAAGNLKSTPEQVVRSEVQESKTVIIIEPAQPDAVYVPTYDPNSIYGPWWYSYPPYYMYPPGYYYPPGLGFAAGIIIGGAIWGNANWGGGNVNVDHHKFNNFNRTNVGNGNWNHNVDHRKGVAYGDNKVAQRYNRGGNNQAAQSREQFRARADRGRAEMQGMDRSRLQSQVGAADRASAGARDRAGSGDLGGRASAGTRDAGSRDVGSRGSGSGFSGAGSSSREASSRGSSSRSSMGGGGSRGGGGGRGGRR